MLYQCYALNIPMLRSIIVEIERDMIQILAKLWYSYRRSSNSLNTGPIWNMMLELCPISLLQYVTSARPQRKVIFVEKQRETRYFGTWTTISIKVSISLSFCWKKVDLFGNDIKLHLFSKILITVSKLFLIFYYFYLKM